MAMITNPLDTLRLHLRKLATEAACGAAYKQWSDAYVKASVMKAWQPSLRDQLTVDQIKGIPSADLLQLGFGYWTNKADLMLIPIWAFHVIADGETLSCIDGKTAVKGVDEIDLDIRFGVIAWGFDKPREAKEAA